MCWIKKQVNITQI